MTLERSSLTLIQEAAAALETIFTGMPAYSPPADLDALRRVLMATADRLVDNYPYPHPLYAGQMLKPPHPIARLAYTLALWINPNNHALDGGKASSAMEKEAVAQLAALFGWDAYLGHLTSGGTFANLEALWIAGCVTGKRKVVASQQAHYTHSRICGVLGIPFESIPTDAQGRMDTAKLEAVLRGGDVGTVVVTIGTTAIGTVDPLPDILALRAQYGFRIHADAAYGGYFTLIDSLDAPTRAAYDALPHVDSIVIDPHKHGLQPYGCGCVMFRDTAAGAYYKHDSPYTYFTSDELHLGEISLECSRAGASAVALWATQQLLPMSRGGEFSQILAQSRAAALGLYSRLAADPRFVAAAPPQLDIVVWCPAGESPAAISAKSRDIFERCEAQHLYLALADLPAALFPALAHLPAGTTVTCLRSVLMKPDHLDWLDEIWQRIDAAAGA